MNGKDYTFIRLHGEAAEAAMTFMAEEDQRGTQRLRGFQALAKTWGAESVELDPRTLRLLFFTFPWDVEPQPRNLWKRVAAGGYRNRWRPRRHSKELWNQVALLPRLEGSDGLAKVLEPFLGKIPTAAISGTLMRFVGCTNFGDDVFLAVPNGIVRPGKGAEVFTIQNEYAEVVPYWQYEKARYEHGQALATSS